MKLKHNSFRTREAAIAGGKEYADKWGKPTSNTAKKREEDKQKAIDDATKAVLDNMRQSLKDMGMSDAAVEFIINKTVNK